MHRGRNATHGTWKLWNPSLKKVPYCCWLKLIFTKGKGENLHCCVLKNSLASHAKAYYFSPSLVYVLPLNMLPLPLSTFLYHYTYMFYFLYPFLNLYSARYYLHSGCCHKSDRFLTVHFWRSKLSGRVRKKEIKKKKNRGRCVHSWLKHGTIMEQSGSRSTLHCPTH